MKLLSNWDEKHLVLIKGQVDIWSFRIPEMIPFLINLKELLSGNERKKAARFFWKADRRRAIVSRGLLRWLLSKYTGVSGEKLDIRLSLAGKPYLYAADLSESCAFNVSHSGDYIVMAFCKQGEVGIDIEYIDKRIDIITLSSQFFSSEESEHVQNAPDSVAAFYNLWTAKEAYLKSLGVGLSQDLNSFSVLNSDLKKTAEFGGGKYHFNKLDINAGYSSCLVTNFQPGINFVDIERLTHPASLINNI